MSVREQIQSAVQSFRDIAKAESPMEATALAAMLQESAFRELIDGIDKLNSSTTDLVKGSNRLLRLTLVLAALTAVLLICTGALVWLTYELTLPTAGD